MAGSRRGAPTPAAPSLTGAIIAARKLRALGAVDAAAAVEGVIAELRFERALTSALRDLVEPATFARAQQRAARNT